MEKTLISIAMFTILLFSSSASAKISDDNVVLGGLVPRTDISTAISVYGEPDKVEHQRYYWGNGFTIISNNLNEISIIETTADNGISTPPGLHVGSTVNEMYLAYGKPDNASLEISGNGYEYYYEGDWNILILVAENNIIKKISACKYIR